MYQPVRLQSGDLVRVSLNCSNPEKAYGILFFLKNQSFLLLPDGIIEEGFPLQSLEWVCHTALVHGSYFRSLEQVKKDFAIGTFAHVIDSLPDAPAKDTINRTSFIKKTKKEAQWLG